MMMLYVLVWFIPLLGVLIGFFTSMVKQYRSWRYGIYFAVLVPAFFFNLQSKSFRIDTIDFFFNQLTLLVFTDFFWRLIRKKNRILRIGGLMIGCFLFSALYKNWLLAGPASFVHERASKCLSELQSHQKIYCIKKHWAPSEKKKSAGALVLVKASKISILEQRIDCYKIPNGYENTCFSFTWDTSGHQVSVQVIDAKDTLWTLGEPLSQ